MAYGIAIGVTALFVVLGLAALWSNNAADSTRFSTILRWAAGAELGVSLAEEDRDGSEPLPRYLEDATIVLQSHRVRNDEVYASEENGLTDDDRLTMVGKRPGIG